MDRSSLTQTLQIMTGITDQTVLLTYLELAAAEVIKTRDPFGVGGITEVEDQYLADQLNIAEYLLNKRGASGQTVHNENGVNRTYESGGVPKSLLKNIMPIGKVLGGNS